MVIFCTLFSYLSHHSIIKVAGRLDINGYFEPYLSQLFFQVQFPVTVGYFLRVRSVV